MRLPAQAYAELLCGLLAEGQPVLTTVHGGSMWPAIPDGSTVRMVPIGGGLRVGEVVVCRREDGRLVLHRLAAVDGDRIQTWGDSCALPDSWGRRDSLIARVVACGTVDTLCPVLVRPPWRMRWRHVKQRLLRLLGRSPQAGGPAVCEPRHDP